MDNTNEKAAVAHAAIALANKIENISKKSGEETGVKGVISHNSKKPLGPIRPDGAGEEDDGIDRDYIDKLTAVNPSLSQAERNRYKNIFKVFKSIIFPGKEAEQLQSKKVKDKLPVQVQESDKDKDKEEKKPGWLALALSALGSIFTGLLKGVGGIASALGSLGSMLFRLTPLLGSVFTGVVSGLGRLIGSLGPMLLRLAPLLGKVALIAGAAWVGWSAGKWLEDNDMNPVRWIMGLPQKSQEERLEAQDQARRDRYYEEQNKKKNQERTERLIGYWGEKNLEIVNGIAKLKGSAATTTEEYEGKTLEEKRAIAKSEVEITLKNPDISDVDKGILRARSERADALTAEYSRLNAAEKKSRLTAEENAKIMDATTSIFDTYRNMLDEVGRVRDWDDVKPTMAFKGSKLYEERAEIWRLLKKREVQEKNAQLVITAKLEADAATTSLGGFSKQINTGTTPEAVLYQGDVTVLQNVITPEDIDDPLVREHLKLMRQKRVSEIDLDKLTNWLNKSESGDLKESRLQVVKEMGFGQDEGALRLADTLDKIGVKIHDMSRAYVDVRPGSTQQIELQKAHLETLQDYDRIEAELIRYLKDVASAISKIDVDNNIKVTSTDPVIIPASKVTVDPVIIPAPKVTVDPVIIPAPKLDNQIDIPATSKIDVDNNIKVTSADLVNVPAPRVTVDPVIIPAPKLDNQIDIPATSITTVVVPPIIPAPINLIPDSSLLEAAVTTPVGTAEDIKSQFNESVVDIPATSITTVVVPPIIPSPINLIPDSSLLEAAVPVPAPVDTIIQSPLGQMTLPVIGEAYKTIIPASIQKTINNNSEAIEVVRSATAPSTETSTDTSTVIYNEKLIENLIKTSTPSLAGSSLDQLKYGHDTPVQHIVEISRESVLRDRLVPGIIPKVDNQITIPANKSITKHETWISNDGDWDQSSGVSWSKDLGYYKAVARPEGGYTKIAIPDYTPPIMHAVNNQIDIPATTPTIVPVPKIDNQIDIPATKIDNQIDIPATTPVNNQIDIPATTPTIVPAPKIDNQINVQAAAMPPVAQNKLQIDLDRPVVQKERKDGGFSGLVQLNSAQEETIKRFVDTSNESMKLTNKSIINSTITNSELLKQAQVHTQLLQAIATNISSVGGNTTVIQGGGSQNKKFRTLNIRDNYMKTGVIKTR